MSGRKAGAGFLAAAVLLGLLAGGLTYRQAAAGAATTMAVTWARPVRPGEVVAADALVLRPVPEGALPPDALARTDEAVGKVTLLGGLPGDAVRAAALAAPDGSDRRVPAVLAGEPERVAYALPGEAAGGAGSLIPPGGAVDVYGVLDLPPGPGAPAAGGVPAAVLLVPRARVLLTRPPTESGTPGVILLLLTREEAARVALAQARGRVVVAQTAPAPGPGAEGGAARPRPAPQVLTTLDSLARGGEMDARP